MALGAKDADDGGQQREDDHDGDDVVNALTDIGYGTAKKIAAENHGADPENAAENVVEQIAGIRHTGGAGDRRTKSANDGNEAGEDDGLAAVFFVEIVSAKEMATAEEKGILAAIYGGAGGATDPVADLVAENRAEHHGKKNPAQRDDAGGGEDTRGDEQGVTGKKKADEETCFNEDDNANEKGAAPADQSFDIVNGLEEMPYVFEHAGLTLGERRTGTRAQERAVANAPHTIR